MADFRERFVDVLTGVALLPVGAGFVVGAMADENISAMTGVVALMGLIIVFLAIGILYEALPSRKKHK